MPPCSSLTMSTTTPTPLNADNFKSLLNNIDTVLLDCDGVLWRGNKAIDGSIEAIKLLQKEENIITTSHLAANFFHSLQPKFDGKVFIVGSQGIGDELDKVKAVIVGFDAHFSYPKLLKAASYLKNPECLFLATNDDETIPETAHPDLICPGS
uniref:Phosphoglycolate phosphatase n=1 Tax=Romanomermis culicivorax TaxID=13658 RepID=A0A915KDC4_ROMCU